MVLESISELYQSKGKITEIAVGMDTSAISVTEQIFISAEKMIGAVINEYDFSSEYIHKNIKECFIKVILTDSAISCGRDDIFACMNESQRRELMEKRLIPELFTPKMLRLRSIDSEDFIAEFEMYAINGDIPEGLLDYYIGRFEEAEIIEIGGESECDHDYFVICGNNVFSINCGMD